MKQGPDTSSGEKRDFHAILTSSGVTLAALELPLLQKVQEKVSMRDIFPPALISVKPSVCVKV